MKINNLNSIYSYTNISRNHDKKSSDTNTNQDNSNVQNDKKDLNKLTQAQKEQVIKLQQRDTHVRAHEAAHLAAAGSVASGGASFTYQKGPDGKMYAIGGEVPIHVTKGNTPKETIAIARQVRAAALAPSDPSPQDLKVASQAAMMEAKALQELNKDQLKALKDLHSDGSNENDNNTNKLDITA